MNSAWAVASACVAKNNVSQQVGPDRACLSTSARFLRPSCHRWRRAFRHCTTARPARSMYRKFLMFGHAPNCTDGVLAMLRWAAWSATRVGGTRIQARRAALRARIHLLAGNICHGRQSRRQLKRLRKKERRHLARDPLCGGAGAAGATANRREMQAQITALNENLKAITQLSLHSAPSLLTATPASQPLPSLEPR